MLAYPIKKFKVYHNYYHSKRKAIEEQRVEPVMRIEETGIDKPESGETSGLSSLANAAATASRAQAASPPKKSRKASTGNQRPVKVCEPVEPEFDENRENFYLYEDDVEINYEDNASLISDGENSFTSERSLRQRRRRRRCSSMSSGVISSRSNSNSHAPSYKNTKAQRRRSLSPTSSLHSAYTNDYDDSGTYYRSCSSLSEFDDYEGTPHPSRQHKHKKHNKTDSKPEENKKCDEGQIFINNNNHNIGHRHRKKQHLIDESQAQVIQATDENCDVNIKLEKDSKSMPQSTQAQMIEQQIEQQQREDRRCKEEYLMHKYKRRFAPYSGNQQFNTEANDVNPNAASNLYLLASSRMNAANSDLNNHHYMHQHKMNPLVDRLSPISDPDLEGNQPGQGGQNNFSTDNPKGVANENNKHSDSVVNDINMLNRINNLSPSSSSSSSSSGKNGQPILNSNASNAIQMFHQQQQSSQQPNTAAAVLAAAAAAAAAAVTSSPPHHHHHSHHQMSGNHVAHHHAQSVAALLADMQQQQQQTQQQEVAKVLAATLSNNSHTHHLTPHHHQLLNRFSNGNQSDLMAAVLQQQQQQQQQQHRSLLDSHHHNHNSHHNSNNFAAALNANGQLYSRYSSHLNAAVAAAAAAAAAAAHSNSSHRRFLQEFLFSYSS